MLYVRTFVTILVSLYTSRVVLSTLGETDFGIYNVVGGVVVLFSFIQNAMTSATQRFLNFELGQGDDNSVSKVFSMSMTAHISIAFLLFVLAETIGLWFVNTQLNIPQDRIIAVQWVYQFSIIVTCINIVRVPYHALIIAHERMNFYAYMSIIESVLKLLIVYLLLISSEDKLIVYAVLMAIVVFITTLCYKIYCNRKFRTSKYVLFWDSDLYKKLMSFSGWSLFGGVANVGASQGVNILMNIFCGVTVNAAMGIANQVQAAVSSFSGNFQTAFNPQLVKSYAAGEHDYFIKLICQTSKYSFYLIYLLVLPMLICAEHILNLWLVEVPEFTVRFTQLMLIFTLIDALSSPLWLSVQATGKIKKYQLLMSFLIALNIPAAYVLLSMGYSPVWVLIAKVLINLITHFIRMIYLKGLIDFPIIEYLLSVMFRIFLLVILTMPFPILIYRNLSGTIGAVIAAFFAVVFIVVSVYWVGVSNEERKLFKQFVNRKLGRG